VASGDLLPVPRGLEYVLRRHWSRFRCWKEEPGRICQADVSYSTTPRRAEGPGAVR
jgi:hypothetical protein